MRHLREAIGALVLVWMCGTAAQAAPDLSGSDPHWIKDAAKNCWAANPDPETGETITWTGTCEQGLLSGEGTLSWYVDGQPVGRDEGHFKNGQLSGHGRIVFGDGAHFEGEFPGQGVLTLPSGQEIAAQSVGEAAGWSIEQAQRAPAR
ncbi:MAG TPA: hypothetical protein VGM72_07285 [Micropepsaceae bacterium]|jgi:hypothetical protein